MFRITWKQIKAKISKEFFFLMYLIFFFKFMFTLSKTNIKQGTSIRKGISSKKNAHTVLVKCQRQNKSRGQAVRQSIKTIMLETIVIPELGKVRQIKLGKVSNLLIRGTSAQGYVPHWCPILLVHSRAGEFRPLEKRGQGAEIEGKGRKQR